MTHALEIIASGTFLWFVLAAGAGVVAYLVLKWPSLCKLLTWPVRVLVSPVLNWLKATKVGVWVKSTKLWLWLESKQYDPPAHPLSWWASRGLVVLWLVGVFGATCFWHGSQSASTKAAGVTYLGTEYVPRVVASAWKARALDCEKPQPVLKLLDSPLVPQVVVPTALPPASDTPVAPPKKAAAKVAKKKTSTWPF